MPVDLGSLPKIFELVETVGVVRAVSIPVVALLIFYFVNDTVRPVFKALGRRLSSFIDGTQEKTTQTDSREE